MFYCEASQGQGWGNWFWTKLGLHPGKATKRAARAGRLGGWAASATLAGLSKVKEEKLGIQDLLFVAGVSSVTMLGYFLMDTIARTMTLYNKDNITKADAIEIIENDLMIGIGNSLLCPTRNSKIDLLEKRNEVLKDTKVENAFLDEICSKLIEKINAAHYPKDQEIEDREVDRYISDLKISIVDLPLPEQMFTLKGLEGEQKTIYQMRAYLSVYYRLENRLKIEKESILKQRAQNVTLPQITLEQQFKKEQKEEQERRKMYQEELDRLEAAAAKKKEMHLKEINRLLEEKPRSFIPSK
jgi:hypothetical protein